MPFKEIYVSGSIAFDRLGRFNDKFSNHILPDKIEIMSVAFVVDGLEEKFGGTAGNIAYSLALLGEEPLILATAGRDFGPYKEHLEKLGLSLAGLKEVDGDQTACAYYTTDLSDNQIIVFNIGAMKTSSGYKIDPVDSLDKIGIVSPGNVEDMMNFCKTYREFGIRYIFDPGQQITLFNGDELEEMLTGSYIFISNGYELEMIMNACNLSKEEILTKVGMIITTMGEDGSTITTTDEVIEIPSAQADKVLDPTGAGDSYRAGLIAGLSQGKSIKEAALMGAVSASYAVEKLGTQEHHFTMDDFNARYQQNFG